jgi:hypothetical protein
MKKTILLLSIFLSLQALHSQDTPNLENFQVLAVKKAKEFNTYIEIIASKENSISDDENAINLACKLFISDTVTIQVSNCPSSGNATIVNRTLIDYLRRLSTLRYDKVTIEWIEVAMVKDLKKGLDGNYYGIISFVQKFTAVKGEYTYTDIVTKNMDIVLKPYKKANELGEDEMKWDVYLSNVNIVEPCS